MSFSFRGNRKRWACGWGLIEFCKCIVRLTRLLLSRWPFGFDHFQLFSNLYECGDEKIENGVWTCTNAKGEVATVVRIEG